MSSVLITVTRSAGNDRAVLVFIDTEGFNPDGSGDGPGLRILVNDNEAYAGVAYDFDPDVSHDALAVQHAVDLADIPYTN